MDKKEFIEQYIALCELAGHFIRTDHFGDAYSLEIAENESHWEDVKRRLKK